MTQASEAEEEPAGELYDFSDFQIGPEIENHIRGLLRDAFEAYLAEGEWVSFADGRLAWLAKLNGRGGFWGDELPIWLSVSPEQFKAAISRLIRHPDYSSEDVSAELARWENACAELREEWLAQ